MKEEKGIAYYYLAIILVSYILKCNLKRIVGEAAYISLIDYSFSKNATALLFFFILFIAFGCDWHRRWIVNWERFITLALCPIVVLLALKYSGYSKLVSLIMITVLIFFIVIQAFICGYRSIHLWRAKRSFRIGRMLVNRGCILMRVFFFLCACLLICDGSLALLKEIRQTVIGQNIEIEGKHVFEVKGDRDNLWETNREQLLGLAQNNFCSMGEEEKTEMLQFLIDLHSVYLGIDKVDLCVEKMQDENIMAYYSHYERKIVLNHKMLSQTSRECMLVVSHELFHSFQRECIENLDFESINIDLLFFREAYQWSKEMNDYHSASEYSAKEDFQLYSQQTLEQSADAYAAKWTNAIEEYILAIKAPL